MSNLVDSMLEEMNKNNSDNVLNYAPVNGQPMHQPMMQQSQGYNPIQPERQVRMGEVRYAPPDQQMPPQMQQGPMQPQLQQIQQQEEDNDAVMDAPDLTTYGMEEGSPSTFNNIINMSKIPLLVAALAFVMSLPQVNGMVRSFVARFTTNSIYVNVAIALIMGLAFFLITQVIDE